MMFNNRDNKLKPSISFSKAGSVPSFSTGNLFGTLVTVIYSVVLYFDFHALDGEFRAFFDIACFEQMQI